MSPYFLVFVIQWPALLPSLLFAFVLLVYPEDDLNAGGENQYQEK
jgi:hypothetical protein